MEQIQANVLTQIFTNMAAQQIAIGRFSRELEHCRARLRQRDRRRMARGWVGCF